MKTCSTCKRILQRCEFRVDRSNPDGLMYHCRKCKSEKEKAAHQKNPAIRKRINDKWKEKRKVYYSDEKRKRKYKHEELLRTFGLTLEQYEQMLQSQNNSCAICKRPERAKNAKKLAVDHCHTTGNIRGLLCSNCNRALGLLEDRTDLLKEAIVYLTKEESNGCE
jgi:hypothetical protein